MNEITINELLNMDDAILVDVRSPGEFAESSIPGAINIPIFTNEERKEVGTLYKQKGAHIAKWRAMEIVSPKLPQILGSIKKIVDEHKQPVLYCARGGMRSGSIATFVDFSGTKVAPIIRWIQGLSPVYTGHDSKAYSQASDCSSWNDRKW